MKLYKFYLRPTKEKDRYFFGREYQIEERYPLYAITTSKKYARLFMKTRDKNKFVFFQPDEIEDEEVYDAFSKRYRDRYLAEYPLESYHVSDKKKLGYATFLATDYEITHTIESIDAGAGIFSSIDTWIPSTDIFSRKIMEALKKLKYNDASKLLGNEIFDKRGYLLPSYDEYSIFELSNVNYDQFMVFILLYGDTLSSSFFDHVKWSLEVPKSADIYTHD